MLDSSSPNRLAPSRDRTCHLLASITAVALALLLSPAVAAPHVGDDNDGGPTPPPASSPSSFGLDAGTTASDPDDPHASLAALPYAPGRLIVKMKAGAGACLDCLHKRGRSIGGAIGAPSLDELNRRFGFRGVRPLRNADAALGTIAARRRAANDRHARRAARASADGQPVDASATPDMTSIYLFELSPWLDMEQAAREYAADPSVALAEPDFEVTTQLVPNDRYFGTDGAWGQSFLDLWGLDLLDASAAWDVGRGSGAVVAVIDTGIDPAHPDLAANLWSNPGEIAANGIDDDGNGYVDDVGGWNFWSDDNDPFDDHGHGTHCAGTIAAVGQNGIGIVGVAFEARVMALKGLSAYGGGYISDLAESILYAAENGADVINASWGGFLESDVLADAIDTAHALGTVFVAAAGNSNLDVTDNVLRRPFNPAAHPRAIAVAAFDHLDRKASFSNFGLKIDVAAPGGGDDGPGFDAFRSVLSLRSSGASKDMTGNNHLIVDSLYLRQAGTSMAAPHAAGVAALVRGLHPEYTPGQVRQALRAGAEDIGPAGNDIESGYGRIHAAGSVGVAALDVEIAAPVTGDVVGTASVSILGSAAGTGFASYSLDYGSGAFPSTWTPIAGPVTTAVSGGTLAVWDLASVPDGDYIVRLRALNGAGDTFEDRAHVTLDHVAISEPAPNTILRPDGSLEIHGTAAGGSFQSFRVEWRSITPDYVIGSWRTTGVTQAGGGTTPVSDGLLATLDTTQFPSNVRLDFRVVVTQGGVEASADRRNVVLDHTLRSGWPQRLPHLPEFASSQRLLHHTTVADLDNDGTKEILASYGNLIYVYRHDGTLLPGWPRGLDGEPAEVFMRRSPAAADLDGDGQLEVVAASGSFPGVVAYWSNPNHGIHIFHADGTPMAGWPKPFRRAFSLNPNDPNSLGGGPRGDFVLSDIDGDGRRDIVAVIGPAVFAIDLDGNVMPGWPQTYPLVWPCLSTTECFESLPAVGDVDGDGRKEIAVVMKGTRASPENEAQSILLYSHDGKIMKGFPRTLSSLHYGPNVAQYAYTNAPILADLDGDSDLEVIAATGSTKIGAFHHSGTPVSLRPRKAVGTDNTRCSGFGGGTVRIPPMLEMPTAGDLDGDGAAELLIGTHAKNWIWRRSGQNISTTICLAQVGGPDFLNVVRPPHLGSLPGWPAQIPFPAGDHAYGPGPAAVGDIDGDLRPEVVIGAGICGRWDPPYRFEDHVCFPIHAFDASGQHLPGFPKAAPYPGSTNGVTPAIGDLDGDGRKEIVWVDFAGQILVFDVPGTPAPEALQWPMFRHDPAHTGALVPNP